MMLNLLFLKKDRLKRISQVVFGVLAVTALSVVSQSANAAYTVVTGSYANSTNADKVVSSQVVLGIPAIKVKTRAVGLKFRSVAGCYDSINEANAGAAEFRKLGARGLWVMKSSLGCVANTTPASNIVSERTNKVKEVKPAKEFAPRRWVFKKGNKIAYTNGESPALYFDEELNNRSDTCRIIVNIEVDSFDDIRPHTEKSRYESVVYNKAFKSNICKIAFVYEVKN